MPLRTHLRAAEPEVVRVTRTETHGGHAVPRVRAEIIHGEVGTVREGLARLPDGTHNVALDVTDVTFLGNVEPRHVAEAVVAARVPGT